MKNYIVITYSDSEYESVIDNMSDHIDSLLDDGWMPQGGINVIYVPHNELMLSEYGYFVMSQAMVR